MTTATSSRCAHLLPLLEALLERLDIPIRREALTLDSRSPSATGGLCRILGRRVILIDPAAPDELTAELFLDALRTLDLSDIYVPPSIREKLEESSPDDRL